MGLDAIVSFLGSHGTQIILICLFIVLNGLRQALKHYFDSKKKFSLVHEFICKFRIFTNEYRQHQFNSELYDWLNYNSGEVQREIGGYGLISYRPQFENIIVDSHPVVVGTLSELRAGKAQDGMISLVDDSLMRYLGDMEKYVNEIRIMTFNPFLWLRYGMQSVIVFPFNFLYWFGIIDKRAISTIKGNPLVKITSFITAGIGILSTIMSIAMGWEQFLQVLKSIFK